MAESKEYLLAGDLLECNQGDTPAGLKITNAKKVNITNKAAANESDNKAVANVPLFGFCTILTNAASGTPTPCSHALTSWDGSKSNVTIGGAKALLKSSSLVCTIGGTIKPQ